MHARALWLGSLLLLSCAHPKASAPGVTPEAVVLGPDLSLRRIAPRVWLHVSAVDDAGRLASNGLLVETTSGTVLVDTGWNDRVAERLIAFSEQRLQKKVVQAVVTHFHADRAGGVNALLARGIPLTMLELTAGRLPGLPPVRTFHEGTTLIEGGRTLELFHPGAGHSPDNVTVYLPEEKLLFGGCFLKAAEADGLGNLADADVAAWPASVARLRERFGGAVTVVPGHGEPGGQGLLAHTERLASAPAR